MSDDFFDGRWEFCEAESNASGRVEQPETTTVNPTEDPTANEPPTTPPGAVSPSDHPRGSFQFDGSATSLIQMMELRGNNGVTEVPNDVETKYLLTGPTYTTPTDIIQLDNPDLYTEVTETSIRYNVTAIAEYVAQLHENSDPPKLIVSVHTHPNGATRPSRVDRRNADTLKNELDRHFRDFEFFQGIHGLQQRSVPDSQSLREVSADGNAISWHGENRHHEVAIYNATFDTPIGVMVT